MKLLVGLIGFLMSAGLLASDETILSCKLTKLEDKSYFKEKLTLEKHKQIEIIRNTRKGLRIEIGDVTFQDEEGGWIIPQPKPTAIGGRIYTIENKKKQHRLTVLIEGVPGRESGRISVTEGKKKERPIASFRCFEERE